MQKISESSHRSNRLPLENDKSLEISCSGKLTFEFASLKFWWRWREKRAQKIHKQREGSDFQLYESQWDDKIVIWLRANSNFFFYCTMFALRKRTQLRKKSSAGKQQIMIILFHFLFSYHKLSHCLAQTSSSPPTMMTSRREFTKKLINGNIIGDKYAPACSDQWKSHHWRLKIHMLSETWHNFCAMSAAAVVDFSSIVTLQHMSRTAAAKCLTGNLRNTADNDRESRAFIVECSFSFIRPIRQHALYAAVQWVCLHRKFFHSHSQQQKKIVYSYMMRHSSAESGKKRKHPEEREGGRVFSRNNMKQMFERCP